MDFLIKMYAEEKEKNAGAELEQLYSKMSASQLEDVLGIKTANWAVASKGEAFAKALEKGKKENRKEPMSAVVKRTEVAAATAKKSLVKK
jgi:hypothetical protein